jgi:hypothetical protein
MHPHAERGDEKGATRRRAQRPSLLVWHSRPRLCGPAKPGHAKAALKRRLSFEHDDENEDDRLFSRVTSHASRISP